MKLLVTIFLFFGLFSNVNSQSSGPPACNDFMTIKGRDFYCGGSKFYPFVCDYMLSIGHNSGPNNDGISAMATDYYLSPYNGYGVNTNLDCIDGVTCLQKLSDDFLFIHQLGFNSIRTGPAPAFNFNNHTKNGEQFTELLPNLTENDFGLWALWNVRPPGAPMTWCGKSFVMSTDLSIPDPYRERCLTMVDELLETAFNNSLKVFLEVQYGIILDPILYPQYLNWMTILSQHIHNLPLNLRQTLAAYCVVEEPQTAGMRGVGYDKHTICEKTSEIYDLIKENDPDHLITIGGGEPSSIQDWDSGVMKYDYVSPHLYPDFNYLSGAASSELNSDFAVERVLGQLYWFKKYCPYPFMIGETGFTASDDAGTNFNNELLFPNVNGKIDIDPNAYYNQKTYMHDVIKMTRDCFGSGFSIWQYQENSDQWGYRDGYGILRVGNPLINPSIKKPVCDEFINYLDANGQPPNPDPNGGQMPASYYDPYHFGTSSSGATSGFVIDGINAEKIKGAFIFGTYLVDQPTNRYSSNYTYSKEESGDAGEFYLLPYDWNHNIITGFNDFYISAVGASRLHYGGYNAGYDSDPSTTIITDIDGNKNYKLDREEYYSNNVQNVTLSASDNMNYSGLSDLIVSNFISESQSTADLKGAFEVILNNESILKNGSEVLIHTGQVFPDCSEFSNYLKVRGAKPIFQSQTDVFDENIELDFKVTKNKMVLFPNPSSGVVNISFALNKILFSEIMIRDAIGTVVYKINNIKHDFSIDLTFLPKGIYFITGSSPTYQQSLKLIIN